MFQELFDKMEKQVWTASAPVALTCMFVMHFLIPEIGIERLIAKIRVKHRERKGILQKLKRR